MNSPVFIRAKQSNADIQKLLSELCQHYEEDIELIRQIGTGRAQSLLDAGALEAGEEALQHANEISGCLAANVALLRELFKEASFGSAIDAPTEEISSDQDVFTPFSFTQDAESNEAPKKQEKDVASSNTADEAAAGAKPICGQNSLFSRIFCGTTSSGGYTTESGSAGKDEVETMDIKEFPRLQLDAGMVPPREYSEGRASEGRSDRGVVLDDSLEQVIDLMVRDWSSAENAKNIRNTVLTPVLDRLRKTMGRVGPSGKALPGKKVWVPGCGMCRLATEIIKYFNCTVVASDESAAMMAALAAMLWRQRPILVHPAAQSFSAGMQGMGSRRLKEECQFMSITGLANDHWPPPRFKLELEHGRIEDVSDKAEAFDAVVTLFVLECVADLPAAVAAVSSTLKPGGIWVNCGPINAPHSPEPRWFMFEDFTAMVEANGLEVLEDSRLHSVEYLPRIVNPGSRKVYEVQLLVARKPIS